jgi:uncharacterized C2H2 Zn-finger protein
MKKFKVYGLLTEYLVLKCPLCGMVFRYNYLENRFGQKVKNTKCQKCEKMFNIKENQLDEDPMFRPWNYPDMIMIKPSGKQEFFSKEEIKDTPDIKSVLD